MFLSRAGAAGLHIEPYHARDRQQVRALIARSEKSHVHLDWHEVEAWLGSVHVPAWLAWEGGRLVGVMAVSEPLGGACWVRLAAAADGHDARAVLAQVWQPLAAELHGLGVRECAFLLIRAWTEALAPVLGFTRSEQIITLARGSSGARPAFPPPPVTLRTAYEADLPGIEAVDHRAFAPPWQMTAADLAGALHAAAFARVAVASEGTARRIVGYQICTLYFDGAHLARLAVAPDMQGQSVGAALVEDAITHFGARGVHAMTVNTQGNNTASQRLYARFGFEHNGYDLPVWTARLD
jgi:ribosomal protein S18 acetylase RimI-like enzyme